MPTSPLASHHTAHPPLPLDAGVAAAHEGAVVVDLSSVRTLTLEGDDVRRWTNGMFTNNTRRLQPGQGNRHCWCDDRGRVQGVLDLYMLTPTKVRCVLEGTPPEAFSERFKMFLLLDDIELEVGDGAPWVLTVQGPHAEGIVKDAGLPTPTTDHAHEGAPDGVRVCRKDRTGLGGFDILCSDDAVFDVHSRLLEAGAASAGEDTLEALRIQAVRAAWPTDGSDKTMVHELRLEAECCAFDKGCYVGQEVINRIDVKGAIQKRLTGLTLSKPVPVGSTVTKEDRKVGRITAVATIGEDNLAVGILRKAVWEVGTQVHVDVDGAPVLATVR